MQSTDAVLAWDETITKRKFVVLLARELKVWRDKPICYDCFNEQPDAGSDFDDLPNIVMEDLCL